MKFLKLYLRMLRYRVAIMLLLFFFLGIAFHLQITSLHLSYLWAVIALASSYVAATSINDIVDQDIDRVNHPLSKGRPLITGEATKRDLILVHLMAVLTALTIGILLGIQATIIIAITLFINYIYSAPPIRLSYRTHLAPLILALAYVAIPYSLGVVVAGSNFYSADWLFLAGLISLFIGRIILKDFRDRKGDTLYGKPTFLLKYGKSATCLVSLIAVLSGNLLLYFALPGSPTLWLILEFYLFAIFFMLYRLWRENQLEGEQVAIGIGAKMGNGLLISLLGVLMLTEYNTDLKIQITFLAIITGVFMANFLFLLRNPNKIIIGYRG